jgi:leucyl aminopeptidase (aminopeptidase T)
VTHAHRALLRAARVLVRTGIKLRFGERLLIVQDTTSDDIAAALAEAADEVGAWVKRARIDAMTSLAGGRPHKTAPERLVLGMAQANASVFVASGPTSEAPMRQEILHLVREHKLRHAHMPGITETAFMAGLTHDCEAVARLGREVLARIEHASVLQVYSSAGTQLRVELPQDARWVAQLGELSPGTWANFPAGALYASPEKVTGVYVADASLGEFFGAREGLLTEKSVRFFLQDGKVVHVESARPELARDIQAMLSFSANSARVGLVALGVNLGVASPVGDAAVDQTAPGLHLGIGDPAGRSTGAGWSAPTCFAACGAAMRVVVDGEVLVDSGKLHGSEEPAKKRRDSPPPLM